MPAQAKYCHIISTDDVLLAQEARDALLAKASSAGFLQRDRLAIDSPSDWQDLIPLTQNQGLFADKRVIDVRYPASKFDKKVQQILLETCEQLDTSTRLILSCGRLTPSQKKAKWFTQLQTHANIQLLWPPKPHELDQWIKHRAQQRGLQLDRSAIALLVQLTVGNLLATNQALEKLTLLFPNEIIRDDHISRVLSDSAQFSVFDLGNQVLQGHYTQAASTLNHLRSTGCEPILILWALAKECRELWQLHTQIKQGQALSQLLQKQWAARKNLLQAAVRRHHYTSLAPILQLAHRIDGAIKGVYRDNVWQLLDEMTWRLCQGTAS